MAYPRHFTRVIQRILCRRHIPSLLCQWNALKYPSAQRARNMQIIHWICLTKFDAATKVVVKTHLGRRRTRDLLLPRLLSGQIPTTTKENHVNA
jgi:hypothetical protein